MVTIPRGPAARGRACALRASHAASIGRIPSGLAFTMEPPYEALCACGGGVMRYHHRRHQSWVLDEFTVTEPRTFCGCCGAFHFQIGPLSHCRWRISLLDRFEPQSSDFQYSVIAQDSARKAPCKCGEADAWTVFCAGSLKSLFCREGGDRVSGENGRVSPFEFRGRNQIQGSGSQGLPPLFIGNCYRNCLALTQ